MTRLRRFRERLVLGPIQRHLEATERILAWSHASIPGTRAPGVLVVTDQRCLVHVCSEKIPDSTTDLDKLSRFKLNRRNPETVKVRLCGDDGDVGVELSLTSRVRSRAAGRVLSALAQHEVHAPRGFDPSTTSPLPAMERRARHHVKRAWVTVAGFLVLLLSAVFASPFVPGPGALTAVAGIAILAREYEWARDLHVWSARQADRFMRWLQGLKRKMRDAHDQETAAALHRSRVIEAVVPGPGPGHPEPGAAGKLAS